MCGIFGISGRITKELIEKVHKYKYLLEHRGPDAERIIHDDNMLMLFKRLSINDLTDNGMQPFISSNKRYTLICNGEIYNYKEINDMIKYNITNKNISDCAYILPLFEYLDYDIDSLVSHLDGEYSIVIYDNFKKVVYTITDILGLRQLYYGYDDDNNMYFSSELKILDKFCMTIKSFPSAYYAIYNIEDKFLQLQEYYKLEDIKINYNITYEQAKLDIRQLLINSVNDKLHADAPLAFLLSGGLDSSLNVGIARYLYPERDIITFTIGFSDDSPDIKAAKLVAEHCNTIHHEFIVDMQEALESIPDVIRCIETYDTTTIRASTLQYLISKNIKKHYPDIKCVVCGETADEIWGSYMYFYDSPDSMANRNERIKLLKEIKNYDGKRADMSCMNYSLESRFPHTSKNILNYVFSLNPDYCNSKIQGIEKKLLREAFTEMNIIPDSILNRVKCAFSDSTSKKSSWKDNIKIYAATKLTDDDRNINYRHLPPRTDEELWYRKVFESIYPNREEILEHFWEPNSTWYKEKINDPSATVLGSFKIDQFDT